MRHATGLIAALAFTALSCVEKIDVNSFPEIPPTNQERIEYIPVLPEWTGFNNPEDVHVGYDELIYVADTQNDRIVMLDLNGTVLGISQRIVKPVAIAQDRKLDLLVVGRKDTVLGGSAIQLAAVFRLNLVAAGHRIEQARPVPVVLHPLYILGRSLRQGDSAVAFTGVATMADNQYYVTRSGPSNSLITQAGGPDNNVLWFGSDDTLVTPLTAWLTATGTGKASANRLSSITTYAVPPQRADVDQRRSFVVSMTGENSFRVQGMMYYLGAEESGFEPEPSFEAVDTSAATRFLYFADIASGRPGGLFIQPEDVTYSADNRYIFAVDAATDSVYQFGSNGYEGIRPPSYSTNRKNVIVSFGGTGSGPTQFRNPHGVAYYQDYKLLLIADTGNNRILRFRLSTDFE